MDADTIVGVMIGAGLMAGGLLFWLAWHFRAPHE